MNGSQQTNLRPRLLLLIPHLGGGGAEQVTALLARGLSPQKYELHLALITQGPGAQSCTETLSLIDRATHED